MIFKKENDFNFETGFKYMTKCASQGDKNAMYYIARAYDTGVGLSKSRSLDWRKSVDMYKRILELSEEKGDQDSCDSGYSEADPNGDSICEPDYIILARLGEMHLNSDHGLEMDASCSYDYFNEAAEKATMYGKGRLANKYYMLAEQASSMIE